MVNLEYLYLLNNNITDIEPLTSLTKLVRLNLNGNPLSSTSKYTYIPILQGYDTDVSWTKSNTKQITSFSIPGQLSSQIIGANITVTMPLATDRSNLTPTIIHDGVSIDPASGAARNFTSPVTYTVTAEDGSQKVYTATVQYPNCNIFIDVHSSLIGTPNPYNTFYGYYQTDIEIVQDGTVLNTVTTDNMGFARVDNLPYGTYTVRLKNPADLTDNGTADVYTDYGNTKSANNTQVSFTLSSGTPAQYVTFVANVPPPLSVYGNVIYYTGTTDNPVITPIANAQITVDDTYTGNIDANGQFIINANHSINFVGAHKVQISTTASHSRIDIELNQIIKQDFSNTDTAQFNLTLSDVKINAISGGYSGQLVIFRVYDLHAPVVTPPQPTHDPDPVDTPSPLPEPSPTVVEEPTKELPASIITGTVKGRVTSVDGTPLSNIRIELHSDPRYTFTDNQGYYSFDNVDLGEHTISINDDKFQEKAKDLKDIKIVLELDKDNNVVVKSVQDSKDAFTDLSLDQDNRDKVINFVVVPKIPDTIKILPQTGDTINPLTVVLIIVIGVLGAVTLIDVIKKRKLKGLMK
jgi:LPXTG-motif cell wall-anchored protein